jgi:hypothetical protein
MQPLDISIFRAVKAAYQKAVRKINAGDTAKVLRHQFIDLYFQIRPIAITKSNIESGWRKSGIYPLDPSIPLNSKWVKQAAVRQQAVPMQFTPNLPSIDLVDAVLSERDWRAKIRDLEAEIRARDARIALLESQLKIANDALALQASVKKRKLVKPRVDSNEKLISFEAIIGTQEAADLEEEEERKRAERRAKKAKKAAKDAQHIVNQAA